ncbi:MAG: hypothetical protein M0R37_15150 [Bacteroidales bacterium]|jgi:hypothetical protein|nr:hypothetical protein [Bacteroidales bacterium]
MAFGTITIENERRLDGGIDFEISAPGDSDYHAGGTPTFSTLLKTAIKDAAAAADDKNVRGYEKVTINAVIDGGCGIWVPLYDKANDKLKMFVRTTGVEVADHVDMKGTTMKLVVLTS